MVNAVAEIVRFMTGISLNPDASPVRVRVGERPDRSGCYTQS